MHVLLATEIWGRTSHVEFMAGSFGRIAEKVTVVDPFDGTDQAFACEEDAYARFLAECGHEQYARRVSEALSRSTIPVFLVGFSAGASAVWSAVCEQAASQAHGACCFYGSAIRTMIERVPTVPVDLIFPDHEPSFDVEETIRLFQERPMTKCHRTAYGHGFMNPLSRNYSETAFKQWSQWLEKRITQFPVREDLDT